MSNNPKSVQVIQSWRDEINAMVRAGQVENAHLVEGTSTKAETPGQIELEKKHGTPFVFAMTTLELIGMISPAEAERAIKDYQKEWDDAL